MRVEERFLQYVKIHTASDENSQSVPTTERQKVLGKLLVQELLALGFADAAMDEKGYVYAHLPARDTAATVRLGWIAHMDTSPDFSGENVHPLLHPDYDGNDIPLSDSGRTLTNAMFPHLGSLKGRTLITSDGRTLLGSDDKAGIAEILTAMEILISSGKPHPALSVAFTPDEEVGTSADHFDLSRFAADFAYTVDGGPENEIVYENFNAASARFSFHGVNIHPGSAKDTMVNAALVAMEANALLPGAEIPAKTEGREGFYHLMDMHGSVEEAELVYIVRDHDAARFDSRLSTLRHIQKTLNEKYGSGTVELEIRESYRNMEEIIRGAFHLVENADAVIRSLGMEPDHAPIRGGTDGARLSFMGLPCPNLGTGGYAYHGPMEHVTVEGMETCVQVILGIIERYSRP